MLVKKSMGSCGARGEWPWREDERLLPSSCVCVKIKVKGVRVKGEGCWEFANGDRIRRHISFFVFF